MYGEHGVEMINDNIISRHTAFSSEKIKENIKNIIENHAGASNQNILHNWDFRNPINQMRQSVYTSIGSTFYSIDRWFGSSLVGFRVSTRSDGIEIFNPDNNIPRGIFQKVENIEMYDGLTLTYSVMFNNEIFSGTFILNSLLSNPHIVTPFGFLSYNATFGFSIHVNPNTSVIIQSVKLEAGSISTLKNDPPMDFGRELAICQRYQLVLNNFRARATSASLNHIEFMIPIIVTMRINPHFSGSADVIDTRGNHLSGFTYETTQQPTNIVRLLARRDAHGLSDGSIFIRTGAIFDANL